VKSINSSKYLNKSSCAHVKDDVETKLSSPIEDFKDEEIITSKYWVKIIQVIHHRRNIHSGALTVLKPLP